MAKEPEDLEPDEPPAEETTPLPLVRRRRRRVRARRSRQAASSPTSASLSSASPRPESSDLRRIRTGYAQVSEKGGHLAHGLLPITGIRLETKAEYTGDLASRLAGVNPLAKTILLAGLDYGIWAELGYFVALLLLAMALDIRLIHPSSFMGLAARRVLGDELAIREEELSELQRERDAAAQQAPGVPRWQPTGAAGAMG